MSLLSAITGLMALNARLKQAACDVLELGKRVARELYEENCAHDAERERVIGDRW